MFQFRAFPSYAYLIQRTILEYCSSGFPHSEISGSTDICSSPKLIAACHVLRRLLMPRHSPCALYSLTLRDILVLFLELCRQSTGYFRKIVIVYPHLFRCSTIKIHNFFQLSLKPSVALLSSHFNTLFSFQGAIRSFGSNRCFASQNCNFFFWNVPARPLRGGLYVALRAIESFSRFEARSQDPISWVLRSNGKIGTGGPEWARTTDLTIISRTL